MVDIVKPESHNILTYEDTQELSVEDNSHSRDDSYDQNKIHSSNSSSQSLSSAVSTTSLPVGTNTSTQQNVIFSLAGRNEQIVVEPIQPNQVQDVSYLGQQIGDYQLICQNSYGQYVLQNSRSVQIGHTGNVSLLVQDSVQPKMTVDTLSGSVQPRMTVDTLSGSVQPRMMVDTLTGSVQTRMTVNTLTGSVQPRMSVDTLTGSAGEAYVENENLEGPSVVHTEQEIEKHLEGE